MPSFITVKSPNDIPGLGKVISEFATEHGGPIAADYQGKQYQLIELNIHKGGAEGAQNAFLRCVVIIALGILARVVPSFYNNVKLTWRPMETAFTVISVGVLARTFYKAFINPSDLTKYYGIEVERTKVADEFGTTTYINPEKVVNEIEIAPNTFVCFGFFVETGKKTLQALTRHGNAAGYTRYLRGPLEALKQAAIHSKDDVLNKILGHHRCPLPIKSTLEHFLTTNEKGVPHFYTFTSANLTTFLGLLINSIAERPYRLPPNKEGESLLKVALKSNDYKAVINLLDTLDPSCLEEIRNEDSLPLIFLQDPEKGDYLSDLMVKRGLLLTPKEALFNSASARYRNFPFDNSVFTSLTGTEKKALFIIANRAQNIPFVKAMKELGMTSSPVYRISGPRFIAPNMDIVQIRETVNSFLIDLKAPEAVDAADYTFETPLVDIVLWGNHIEEIAAKHQLNRIKVPKRKITLTPFNEYKAVINERGFPRIFIRNLMTNKLATQVYVENIEKVRRLLSLEEVKQLMTLLEHTGLRETQPIAIAKEGVYIMNATHQNCNPDYPCWNAIESLKQFLKAEDVQHFIEEMNKRKKAWEAGAADRVNEHAEADIYYNDPLNSLEKVWLNREILLQD